MKHILKCAKCGKYTMQTKCCNKETINPKPAKYSVDDKYGSYRRKARRNDLEKRGVL